MKTDSFESSSVFVPQLQRGRSRLHSQAQPPTINSRDCRIVPFVCIFRLDTCRQTPLVRVFSACPERSIFPVRFVTIV